MAEHGNFSLPKTDCDRAAQLLLAGAASSASPRCHTEEIDDVAAARGRWCDVVQ
jgi:hypothetical protein